MMQIAVIFLYQSPIIKYSFILKLDLFLINHKALKNIILFFINFWTMYYGQPHSSMILLYLIFNDLSKEYFVKK
jgi:hypothetical protein